MDTILGVAPHVLVGLLAAAMLAGWIDAVVGSERVTRMIVAIIVLSGSSARKTVPKATKKAARLMAIETWIGSVLRPSVGSTASASKPRASSSRKTRRRYQPWRSKQRMKESR